MKWKPITEEQLEKELEIQCAQLDEEELAYFNKIKVSFESVRIDRWGKLEPVFIVARKEGGEIGKVNEQGIIVEFGSNQFTIQQVDNQLFVSNP